MPRPTVPSPPSDSDESAAGSQFASFGAAAGPGRSRPPATPWRRHATLVVLAIAAVAVLKLALGG